MFNWGVKKSITSLSQKLPREELIRRSRILIVDDEEIDLVADLKSSRFSVDHEKDIGTHNIDLIDKRLYDLILLDFGKVGSHFGDDQGLSLLRYIKRVNPSVVVLAYTSKALKPGQAEFFRLSDGVLSKDAGITDSMEKIEEGLRKAHSIISVWSALLAVCDVRPGSDEDKTMQDLLIRGLTNQSKMSKLKADILGMLTSDEAKAAAMTVIEKVAEIGIKALVK
jgi:DNA-binding NarL/FixJ family response regulator